MKNERKLKLRREIFVYIKNKNLNEANKNKHLLFFKHNDGGKSYFAKDDEWKILAIIKM